MLDLLLPFGEDLEQQLGAAAVQLQVAEFVDQEEIDAAVAGDGAGQLPVVGGFGELVDQLRGQGVLDPVAVFGGGGAQRDQQVGLAGAGVPDQTQRLAVADPVAGGELVRWWPG